uniref:NADH-ubiquinone oxidoreductase chain 4L n=1 Tax=Alloeorhynchus sp. TaxID=2931281 RepID=A0A8T9ZXP0_9HEMI|nr:NADH dehydrogenase subunit 4L [Alloeorhynchus sp.]
MYIYTPLLMFITSMMVFCSARKHLLLTLLSLEMLVLSLFLILFNFILNYGCGAYFIFIFLTFSVCEGCLGLSILVSLIRSHGNDNLSSMSLLSW